MSDENIVPVGVVPQDVGGVDSFWEIGQYKRTVKRVDEGYKLTSDMIEMLKERCTLEQEYASKLKHWSKSWSSRIEKSSEYGTMESTMRGVLLEADQLSDKRLDVRTRLLNDVISQVKEWQKRSYKSTMIPGYVTKQAKDFDDMFRKVQKPWAKLYEKVAKSKSDYHKACKSEKTAINQENNSRSDTSQSQDNQSKLRKAVEKWRDEKVRCGKVYEAALRDLNQYNAKYMEDMRDVFDRCQALEEERLRFFQSILFNMHQALDNTHEYPQIYQELYDCVGQADYNRDLQWWSNNHGVHMTMNWPIFQEYSEDLHDITDKSKKGVVAEGGGILLTNINLQRFNEEFTDYTPETHAIHRKEKIGHVNDGVTLTAVANLPSNATVQANGKNTLSSTSSNPFEDEEEPWEDYPTDLVDNGEPGIPVVALYDYQGTEEDELTFKQGDEFVKLEDEDDQGWCKGRMNGRVGLYPANYVDGVGQ